ncbi:MAG: LysR substrate-binding domain-containing protein [Azospirillaceae bacterium]|nr:LysR substrate-binding domain-containing protein [Azospirillaceae bacterium]
MTDFVQTEGSIRAILRDMRFDLTDFRLFLCVIEAGSITHGAASACLSLAAASERLRGMEAACGVRLLARNRRGVAPTAAGDALAHHARLILRQVDQLNGELGGYAKGLRGTIRLLANTAAMTEFLPERLAPFLAAHPQVDIDLKERLSSEIVKAVSRDRAEIGIISDAVDAAGLTLRPFAIDRLVVVMSRNDELATRRRIALADILRRDFVGLSPGSALQDHIDGYAAQSGTALRLRVRVRTFEGICRMVAHGVALGIVPENAARRCRRTLPIRITPLTDAWATRHLHLCTRDRESLTPLARQLADHLGSNAEPAFADHCDGLGRSPRHDRLLDQRIADARPAAQFGE